MKELHIEIAAAGKEYLECAEWVKKCANLLMPDNFVGVWDYSIAVETCSKLATPPGYEKWGWWMHGDFARMRCASFAVSSCRPVLVVDADATIDCAFDWMSKPDTCMACPGCEGAHYESNYKKILSEAGVPVNHIILACTTYATRCLREYWDKWAEPVMKSWDRLGLHAESPTMLIWNAIWNDLYSQGKAEMLPPKYHYHRLTVWNEQTRKKDPSVLEQHYKKLLEAK